MLTLDVLLVENLYVRQIGLKHWLHGQQALLFVQSIQAFQQV